MGHDPVVGPHEAANLMCPFNLGASTLPWRRHRLNENLLSTHSNIACPSNPPNINHPCAEWLSIFFATCLGLASSNAVSMSMLGKYIVGRTCHASTWESFPPAIPCALVADLSSSLASAGNLFRQPHAISSSSQVLFLFPDEE